MRPRDVVSGYRLAQDHDPRQELHGRQVGYALRVERTTDAGDVLPEGGQAPAAVGPGVELSASPDLSVGDDHGSILWRAEPGARPIPMWWAGAAPAVTVEPGREVAGDPAGARRRVRVLPVGASNGEPDDRFRPVDAALAYGLPSGYPGVVLVTSQERSQEELFLPAGGPLVAVHRGPDVAASSLVSDTTPDGALDPERQAGLHELARVVRRAPAPTLALQLGLEAGGLVADQPSVGGALPGGAGLGATVERGTVGAQALGALSARLGGPIDVGGEVDQHQLGLSADGEPINAAHLSTGALWRTPRGIGDGPLEFRGALYQPAEQGPHRAQVHVDWDPTARHPWSPSAGLGSGMWRLSAEVPYHVPQEPGGGRVITGGGPTGGAGTTRERRGPAPLDRSTPRGGGGGGWEPGDPDPGAGPGGFDPLADRRGGPGPLPPDVEGGGPPGPPPVEFDPVLDKLGRPVDEADSSNARASEAGSDPALRAAAKAANAAADAIAAGVATLWGSGPTERDEDDAPPAPKPEDVEEAVAVGVPAEEAGEADLTPGQADEAVRLRLRDQIRPGSRKIRVHKIDKGSLRDQILTFGSRIRAGAGIVLRAYATTDGAPDTTGSLESPTGEELEQLDSAPDVVVIDSYGAGGQSPDRWTKSRTQQGQLVAAGAAVVLPAGVRLKTLLEDAVQAVVDAGGRVASFLIPGGTAGTLGQLGWGMPHPESGGVASGVTARSDGAGLLLEVTDADGEVPGGSPTFRFGEGGAVFDCDVHITGKATIDGMVDPPGIDLTEQASRPSTPAAGHSAIWVRSSDGALMITDDTPTDTVIGSASGGAFPVGSVMAFARTAAPTGWLACDGAAVSRATYAALYAVLGDACGPGNGTTTFNVPDLRGRALGGTGTGAGGGAEDTNGGSAPAGGTALTARSLGEWTGAETHVLAESEIPAHTHAPTDPGHTHNVDAHTDAGVGANDNLVRNLDTSSANADLSGGALVNTTGITIATTGGGGAHQNMPPILFLLVCVKT